MTSTFLRPLSGLLLAAWPHLAGATALLAAAPAQGVPEAKVVVAPALHAAAESFSPALVCATVSVPLAQGWHVGEVDGRPALSLSGSDVWSFRTLDTWPDGSVKWALCEALVPAGEGVPPPDLRVRQGTGSAGIPSLAKDTAHHVDVDTGPLQVRIDKQPFKLFDVVVADGQALVTPGGQGGIAAKAVDGQMLTVRQDPDVRLECNGPARAVVRIDGTLERGNGNAVVDFTCRLAFVRTSHDVQVTFTVRNARRDNPGHAQLESLELVVDGNLGGAPTARFALPGGSLQTALAADSWATAYQARSNAPTQMTTGFTPNYLPHLPKLDDDTYVQEGYAVYHDDQQLFLGGRDSWPGSSWTDLTGAQGGITVAFQQMAYEWPAALSCSGAGQVSAGLFPGANPAPYTWVWRQHESRTVGFSFHAGPVVAPEQVARRLEAPVVGRMADYRAYAVTGVLAPYDLVTVAEQEQVYALLGTPHTISAPNASLLVTRFYPASTGGGPNNHDWILRSLAGEYLRFGTGGSWMNAMDLALYKSEWQILRSDDFLSWEDPGPINFDLPHSKAFASDDEHRYREGMALAFWLSGDERIREALYDEAENLPTVDLWPQERGMYQTLRALACVATFTHNEKALDQVLRHRLHYYDLPTIDVDTATEGWGWDGPPGQGVRGYFVNSGQHQSEKAPGEHFVSRGFVSGSMGPIALFVAARHLGDTDPDAFIAHLRLRDLATYTRDELFPHVANPADRHLVYSYGVSQKQVNEWEQWDFHPIQLGMAEAWRQTGDASYLLRGAEQVQAFAAHGHLKELDHRVEFQHYCRAVLDSLGGG
jgi:hypothetical protein